MRCSTAKAFAPTSKIPDLKPLLEVQLVDAADSITYDAHDTDDAVKLGLLSLDELAEVPLIREMLRRVNDRFSGLSPRVLRQTLVHELIDYQVSDVLRRCGQYLATARFAERTAGSTCAVSDRAE